MNYGVNYFSDYVLDEDGVVPKESGIIGVCLACEDPVYEGDFVYTGVEGIIHTECMKEYLFEKSLDELAEAFGWE